MGSRAEERFRFFALPQFKQAFREAYARIVQRLDSKCATVETCSPFVIAAPNHSRCESEQSVVMRRMCCMDLSEYRQRPVTLVALCQNISERKLQIGGMRLECQPAFRDRQRLVKLSALAQLECKLGKSRHVRRPPADSTAKLIHRFALAANSGKHTRQQRLDRRLLGSAHKFRQVPDRILEAALRQQGAPQNLSSKRIAAV